MSRDQCPLTCLVSHYFVIINSVGLYLYLIYHLFAVSAVPTTTESEHLSCLSVCLCVPLSFSNQPTYSLSYFWSKHVSYISADVAYSMCTVSALYTFS